MVMYRSPECIGYAELEFSWQPWKYMTICCISFHPCRSITKQIWPCHKSGQGQPSVIIWANLVVLEYPMLYTKFQGHRPLGSEEGDFWKFLQYMGLEAISVIWRGTFKHILILINPWRLNMKFGFYRPSVFEEKKFENVESEWPWTKVSEWPWPSIFIKVHVLI